jgi:hypothetical protein
MFGALTILLQLEEWLKDEGKRIAVKFLGDFPSFFFINLSINFEFGPAKFVMNFLFLNFLTGDQG